MCAGIFASVCVCVMAMCEAVMGGGGSSRCADRLSSKRRLCDFKSYMVTGKRKNIVGQKNNYDFCRNFLIRRKFLVEMVNSYI